MWLYLMNNPKTGQNHPEAIRRPDREVLRRLAGQKAELAARPCEQEKRDLWYRHNTLQPTRPLVFCDPENGWTEIIPPAELECEDELARAWEMGLRMEIFWGEKMQDDLVIEPFFNVLRVYDETDWGMHEARVGGENGGAYRWEAPLKDYADLPKLHFPRIAIDHDATTRKQQVAQEILGDLLTVRVMTWWWWSVGLTSTLAKLRGLEQIMYDMLDRPDDLHRLMAFLRDGTLARLDFLERNGLLSPNNNGSYVGSGGFGWTSELPEANSDGTVRTRDMWGFAESQDTVGISPAMYAEFVFPYQLPLLERFGLNCYGCCEPLDKRWQIVEKVPRLRRVSVSPWSNVPFMAECLGDRYIFSMKPNPTDLAMPSFDEDSIRSNLRQALQVTRKCHVEVIMKDNHTICHDPRRVIRWVQIAREEAEAV